MILTRDFAVSQVYSCVFKQWKTVGFFCCKRVCPRGGMDMESGGFQADTTGTLNALHRGSVRVRSL
jgi:hypothetical protein